MKTRIQTSLLTALLGVVFTIGVRAQGTAFTYQGRLQASGSPASGIYDLRFAIYDSATGGTAIANPQTNSAVAITNGLFTVTLDFGSQFSGADRWLEIGVRTNGAASFVELSPRQKLTPTPYAITAGNVVSGGLPDTYSGAVNFNNSGNSFSGSGAGLTSLNASSLSGGIVSDARLSTNVALLDRNQTFTADQTFGGQLILPSPMATVYSGGATILHSDGNKANFFAGLAAGNLVVSGSGNTAIGEDALIGDLSGSGNTASGTFALQSNNSGGNNTADGFEALYFNASSGNTADGAQSLYSNTSGSNNVANGYQALDANTSGSINTAVGVEALYENTSGGGNTALGAYAMESNIGGIYNVANGAYTLADNVNGSFNTASGEAALESDMSGGYNTATGAHALAANTNGVFNVANGVFALQANASGRNNTANGAYALYEDMGGSNNVANGYHALYAITSGADNIGIGDGAGSGLTTGSGNVDIGNPGASSDDHTIKIGQQGTQTKTFIAGISGTSVSGAPVYVNASGQLGTNTNSPAFVQTVTAGNLNGNNSTVIDNPRCNGKPDVILIVTANGTNGTFYNGTALSVVYDGTHWLIVSLSASLAVGQQFNVLVFNP